MHTLRLGVGVVPVAKTTHRISVKDEIITIKRDSNDVSVPGFGQTLSGTYSRPCPHVHRSFFFFWIIYL